MIRPLLVRFAKLFEEQRSPFVPSSVMERRDLVILSLLTVLAFAIRIVGIGDIGLHGDEETNAMVVKHIVEEGGPLFPSGMFYARAIAQLYIMAASVMAFGETEWAMRLPSVLCGVALVPLSYFLGRRFLEPAFALLLAGVTACLPEFIEYSQTARMYIFMVTGLVVYALCIHRWERTGGAGALAGAVLALLVTVHFHSLAILGAALYFFPGLLRGDLRRLTEGAAALVATGIGFLLVDGWVEGQYPEMPSRATAVDEVLAESGSFGLATGLLPWQAILAGVVVFVLAWMLTTGIRAIALRILTGLLVVGGFSAQALRSYHIAVLLLLVAAVLGMRSLADRRHAAEEQHGTLVYAAIVGSVLLFLAVAALDVVALRREGVSSVTRLVGALCGIPSLWPYVRLASFSWFAAILAAAGAGLAVWRMANQRPIHPVWLYFVLTLLLPVLVIGVARWNVPTRYVAGSVMPLLLTATVVLQMAYAGIRASLRQHTWERGGLAVAAAASAALMIGPLTFYANVNSGYAQHPDHKGAADFLKSEGVGPGDILIAEDVLQQTWYLGKVDYWLIGPEVGQLFAEPEGDVARDIYTHTPILDSAARFRAIVNDSGRNVYVIGSGENQRDGRRGMRGDELHELLETLPLVVLHEGRDGLTRVWRVPRDPASLQGDQAVLTRQAGTEPPPDVAAMPANGNPSRGD